MKGIVRLATAGCFLALGVGVMPAQADHHGARRAGDPVLFNDSGPTGGRFVPADKVETRTPAHGASIVWKRASGSVAPHNVRQSQGLFDSGEPTADFDHFRAQLSAGSFTYYCTLHGSRSGQGMAGTIAVKPSVVRESAARYRVKWAGKSTTGDRYDVDWRVKGSKTWRHWKRATSGDSATFGGGSPVTVNPDKRYEIRVRSFDHAKTSRKSDWSPATVIGRRG